MLSNWNRQQVAALLSLLCILLTIGVQELGLLRTADLKTLDWRFVWRERLGIHPPVDPRLAIIAIDDQTDKRLATPRLFWGPAHSQIFSALVTAKPLGIALDIIQTKGLSWLPGWM